MTIRILLLLLQISFTIHIYFIIQYVLKKEGRYLRGFINTAIINILLAGTLTFVILYKPELARKINLKLLFWIMSGFVMMTMLFVKIMIFRNMYRRAKDPANFHYNFFGKKVLHSRVVLVEEIYVFLFTIPFFLFSGAYFVARLFNLILYKHF